MDGSKYSQNVSAFKCQDSLILVSNVKTGQGLWYLHQPIVILDAHLPVSQIGSALLRTLAATQTGFAEPPTQTELETTVKKLVQAASVHSFEEFMQHTQHCVVGRYEAGIEIVPTHKGDLQDETEGLQFLVTKRILVEAEALPEKLGQALLQGFAACTAADG
jgi:hypothetical protein